MPLAPQPCKRLHAWFIFLHKGNQGGCVSRADHWSVTCELQLLPATFCTRQTPPAINSMHPYANLLHLSYIETSGDLLQPRIALCPACTQPGTAHQQPLSPLLRANCTSLCMHRSSRPATMLLPIASCFKSVIPTAKTRQLRPLPSLSLLPCESREESLLLAQ